MQQDHHAPEYSHRDSGTAGEAAAGVQEDSPLPPRAAYNLWAQSYATTGRNPVTAAAARALLDVLPPVSDQRVLDIACGDGRRSRHALAQGAAWVVGVDFSAGMLAAAHAVDSNIALLAADMRDLPFPEASFDLAIHALALGHVPDPAPAIRAAAGVLVPGGVLALVDLHPDAAARGWRRTFRDTGGQAREVRWFPHAIDTVMAACARAGLTVERFVERPLDLSSLPPDAPTEAGGLAVYALAAIMRPTRPPPPPRCTPQA